MPKRVNQCLFQGESDREASRGVVAAFSDGMQENLLSRLNIRPLVPKDKPLLKEVC